MSTLYVINLLSNSNGYHIVHRYGCMEFPDNYYELGLYESCTQAVHSAKRILSNATCCTSCISDCRDTEHHHQDLLQIAKKFKLETENRNN